MADEEEEIEGPATYTKSTGAVTVYEPDEVENTLPRAQWGRHIEYFLSLLSYAIGLGNVWRFSYLCQKNGGGAFLIPYFIMAIVEGLPLFYLELLVGQSVRRGAFGVWRILNPRLSGIGIASAVVSCLIGIYYNVLITWCWWYFARSFFNPLQSIFQTRFIPLPWSIDAPCGEQQCAGLGLNGTAVDGLGLLSMATNHSDPTCRRVPQSDVDPPRKIEWSSGTPPSSGAGDLLLYTWSEAAPECSSGSRTQYFFYRRSLDITERIDDMGGFNLHLFIFLTLAWLITYVCLLRGIQSTGKVVYFTALFPYAVLLIFFIRAVTLTGFHYGLLFLFWPKFEKLLEPQVWLDAACQIFFSLSLGWGGIIAMASFSPRKNNCKRDAILMTICNCSTGLLVASIIFSILGNKAYETAHSCMNEHVHTLLPHVISANYSSWLHELQGVIGDGGGYRVLWKRLVDQLALENNVSLSSNTTSISNVLQPALALVAVNASSLSFSVHADAAKLTTSGNSSVAHFWRERNFKLDLEFCDLNADLNKVASGTGLAFIAFTEAIDRFIFPPLWSVLFFLMLLALGVGTEFGTLLGVITCFEDVVEWRLQHHLTKWYTSKWFLAGVLSFVSYAVGVLFMFGNGYYFVDVFDLFGATFPLLLIALFECLAVLFYAGKIKNNSAKELLTSGINRLRYWHHYIYNDELSVIWTVGWYIAPIVLILVLLATLVQRAINPFEYKAYNRTLGTLNEEGTRYPVWVIPLGFVLTAASIAFIPIMFFYYRNNPWVGRAKRTPPQVEPPAASETDPGTASQRPLINRNESTDEFVQSDSSLGVGDSILLNSNTPMSSREKQSDRNSRGRKSVSIMEDNIVHYKTGSEIEGEPTFTVSPPPESSRRRNRSGSNNDKDPK